MQAPRCLTKAILIWKAGYPIDLVLETELMSLGFDVRSLQDRYFNP